MPQAHLQNILSNYTVRYIVIGLKTFDLQSFILFFHSHAKQKFILINYKIYQNLHMVLRMVNIAEYYKGRIY